MRQEKKQKCFETVANIEIRDSQVRRRKGGQIERERQRNKEITLKRKAGGNRKKGRERLGQRERQGQDWDTERDRVSIGTHRETKSGLGHTERQSKEKSDKH